MSQQERLLEYLKRERGVGDDCLERLEKERIDERTLPLLSEEELKTYLPSKGDRIAAVQFCSKKGEKQTLLDRLRQRFGEGETEENRPIKKPRGLILKGNANAMKSTKSVEVGWLNYCHQKGAYKQVRIQCGGGTRVIPFEKQDTAAYVLEKGKSLFFPNGKSKKGPASNYEFEVCDFQEQPVSETVTIAELIAQSYTKTLRLYVGTKRRESETGMPPMKRLRRKRPKVYSSREIDDSEMQSNNSAIPSSNSSPKTSDSAGLTYNPVIPSNSTALSSNNSTMSLTNNSVMSAIPTQGRDLLSLAVELSAVPNVSENTESSETDEIQNEEIIFTGTSQGTYLSENLANDILDLESLGSSVQNVQAHVPTDNLTVEMTIHRGPLAFQEFLGYFKDDSIMEKSLKIKRILPNGEQEMAEDSGGVLRDLLTEFWKAFYEIATLGRDVKVPAIRHDFSAVEWEAVGRVLVYGYKRTSYWPVMLAKTFVLQCLFPDIETNKDSLLEDFYNYVSRQDMEIFKKALEDYGAVDNDDLFESLDMYECKTGPNAENIKPLLLEIAHAVIIQKPNYVSSSMKSVMHKLNLNRETVDQMYMNLVPSNRAVLKLLKFPEHMDPQETETANHLKRYVRDCDGEKLGLFLRYCTGSDLLTMAGITVEFVVMLKFQRCPIAHTCTCMLQLSKTYESFMDFRAEFDNILSSNVWVMDGI